VTVWLEGLALIARVANHAAAGRQIRLLGGRIAVDAPDLAVRPARAIEAVGLVVRRAGIALPALVFFFGWALLYSVLWLLDPGVCTADAAATCTHAAGRGGRSDDGRRHVAAANRAGPTRPARPAR